MATNPLVAIALTGACASAYEFAPWGSVKAKGWLENTLDTQMNGLTGHLPEMWNEVYDSSWLGGKSGYQEGFS